MKDGVGVIVRKIDLTDAQKHALYRSIENHMRKVSEGNASPEGAIRLDKSISGSTAMALDRKGCVIRSQDPYRYRGHTYMVTKEGRRLGVEEFERLRGKTPIAWAEELQEAADKKARERQERIDGVANLFTGFTVTVDKKRRALPKVLAERIAREGPQVKLHEKELKQLGEQIRKLVP